MPKICVITGDGIGKEVVPETLRVLNEVHDFEYIEAHAGYECFKRCGESIPESTIQTAKNSDSILFGSVTTPKPTELKNKPYRSPILTLRQELDLYANIRPTYNFKDLDFVIIRENTECLYVKREYYDEINEVAIAERIISKKGSERIIKFAFEYARLNNRKKVSCIHKANVLRVTDGLFLEIFEKIAKLYENFGISSNDYLIDATAMYLIKNPYMFDVMVTTNLFGDILSDEAAGLIGGLGMSPSANIGDNLGLFEPVHGSAPDIAGKGISNPIATILSASMMLDHLKMNKKAEIIRNAVKKTINNGYLTPDLGGSLKTSEVVNKVIEFIRDEI